MATPTSGALGLSEDHIKLLIACFNDADGSHSFDGDKIAAAVGTTKKNLYVFKTLYHASVDELLDELLTSGRSVRMTRLRQRIAKVDLACENREVSAPGTPKTPKTPRTSQAKAGSKRKTGADDEGGSPKKKGTKPVGESKEVDEVKVKEEQVDGGDAHMSGNAFDVNGGAEESDAEAV